MVNMQKCGRGKSCRDFCVEAREEPEVRVTCRRQYLVQVGVFYGSQTRIMEI
jgi:hypothetical protein